MGGFEESESGSGSSSSSDSGGGNASGGNGGGGDGFDVDDVLVQSMISQVIIFISFFFFRFPPLNSLLDLFLTPLLLGHGYGPC